MTFTTDFRQLHVDQSNQFVMLAGQTTLDITNGAFDTAGTQVGGLYVSPELAGATLTFMVGNTSQFALSEMYDGNPAGMNPVSYVLPATINAPFVYFPLSIPAFAFVKYVQIVSDTAPLTDATIIIASRPT